MVTVSPFCFWVTVLNNKVVVEMSPRHFIPLDKICVKCCHLTNLHFWPLTEFEEILSRCRWDVAFTRMGQVTRKQKSLLRYRRRGGIKRKEIVAIRTQGTRSSTLFSLCEEKGEVAWRGFGISISALESFWDFRETNPKESQRYWLLHFFFFLKKRLLNIVSQTCGFRFFSPCF